MLILRIVTFLYGLLTVTAIGEEAKSNGIQWVHGLYPVFSLCLMYIAIKVEPSIVLYIGLFGLFIAAITSGLITNTFQWKHIIARLVISLILLWSWNNLS